MNIRNACAVLGAALTLTGCATIDDASADANPIIGSIREGRCHMGGCSWFQVQNFDVVRETEKGALLRVSMRSGSSDHPNGDYPERPRESAISWSPAAESYFFCSKSYPAIVSRSDTGGYEGFRLDMTTSYGAIEAVQNEYRAICHPDGDMAASDSAARLGYTALVGEPELLLARPEELFDRLD